MIEPKSAIEAAEIRSWPKLPLMSPESLSTGTITQSEVATSTIAANSGDLANPPAFRPRGTAGRRVRSGRGSMQGHRAGPTRDPRGRGADHDPQHDLEHDCGNRILGKKAKRERREEPNRCDDQKIREVDSRHDLSLLTGAGRPLRGAGAARVREVTSGPLLPSRRRRPWLRVCLPLRCRGMRATPS